MTRRRLQFSFVCVLIASAALFALPVVSASAAGTKVLLVTRGEEGAGPPAVQGERAHVTNYLRWPALGTICGGSDEMATVGKNPSPTVKVTGSDAPSGATCFLESDFELEPGNITVKSISITKAGVVSLTGKLEVTAGGECTYRATKLTGEQGFAPEEEWSGTLRGTGKRVAPSAKTCAKTTPVEDGIGVANAEGYNYIVKLTS
jgi:hypothetical protein